jgi:hypothetical protein
MRGSPGAQRPTRSAPFIESNPGLDHYLFDQVVGPTEVFRRSKFYEEFASVEGWDKGFSGM